MENSRHWYRYPTVSCSGTCSTSVFLKFSSVVAVVVVVVVFVVVIVVVAAASLAVAIELANRQNQMKSKYMEFSFFARTKFLL